jgi:hypothetical protein
MEVLLALLIVLALAWFVSAPLRAGGRRAEASEDPVIADLEARKEAKYREIRDAELDREQGKLSQADWARLDAQLRREAIEILKELDRVRGRARERG